MQTIANRKRLVLKKIWAPGEGGRRNIGRASEAEGAIFAEIE